MFWHEGMGFAGWWGAGLWMLLFWALVIAGIVVLVRWTSGSRWSEHSAPMPPAHHEPPADVVRADPQRILDERFARGEIDEDEYRRRREVLRGEVPPAS